jgi:signal transduction histidine kinase
METEQTNTQDKQEDKQANKQAEQISLEEARNLVEELRQANAERLALIEREERLRVENLLGGHSEAAIKVDEPSEEDKKRARVNQMLEGTGFKI